MPIGVPLYRALQRQDDIITIKIYVRLTVSPQCAILPRVPYANCPFLGLTLFIVTIADPLEKLSWSWQDILEHLVGGFLSESGYIASWRKDRFE